MIAVRENGAASGVGVLARYTYDDLGRRVSTLHGNGTVTSYGYDAVSRLASLSHDLAGTGQDYAASFAHSPASQIVSREQTNGLYDWTPPPPGTVAANHNDLDQVTAAAGTAIAHDANGNLATWGAWSFAYDIENRLKQITGPVSMSLAYDPLGRLAQTVSGGATTNFLYDGSDLVAEYDGAGNLVRRYVHGPSVDEPLVWYEGAGTASRRWLHADERGSVIAMSSATGSSLATWRHGPHGESTDPAFTRFGYTGQLDLPGTPVHHFKARAYAPDLGRFLQPDPIGFAGGATNLYAYAGNDPVNFTDPSGLLFGKIFKGLKKVAKKAFKVAKVAQAIATVTNPEVGLLARIIAGATLVKTGAGAIGGGRGNAGETPGLTDDQIAHIVFNESVSLSGPSIGRARTSIANIVINRFRAGLAVGDCVQTACDRPTRTISPFEQTILAEILAHVPEVRAARAQGTDPTFGARFFGFRDLNKYTVTGAAGLTTLRPRFGTQFPIPRAVIGPFSNSAPSEALGPTGIFFVPFQEFP